jgi:monothiol glutaredoxin
MTPDDVKDLVESTKVVLFMKGTKMFPRCGFSARAVAVLNELNVPFEAVDIFSDPSVRPSLVEYSKWPTTPQVFVGGKLVGGSDLVLEMYENGDLKKLVTPLFAETDSASA